MLLSDLAWQAYIDFGGVPGIHHHIYYTHMCATRVFMIAHFTLRHTFVDL
jgi:hypothetical protein